MQYFIKYRRKSSIGYLFDEKPKLSELSEHIFSIISRTKSIQKIKHATILFLNLYTTSINFSKKVRRRAILDFSLLLVV